MSQPEPAVGAAPTTSIIPWICLCAVVDFFTPPMMRGVESPGFMGFLIGQAAGQFGVLTVWTVFGPPRLLVRWTQGLLGAVLLYGMAIAGTALTVPLGRVDAEVWSTMLMLPLVFLAAQSPLWVLRMIAGWKIVRRGNEVEQRPAAARQFGLKHLLGATTALAAILGLVRLGFSVGEVPSGEATAEMWIALLIACVAGALWNGLLTIPCLYVAMAARDKPTGCLVLAGYAVVIGIAVPMVIAVLVGNGPPPDALMAFLALHAATILMGFGSLYWFGRHGYILHRPRATHSQAEATAPATTEAEDAESSADRSPPGSPFRDTPG